MPTQLLNQKAVINLSLPFAILKNFFPESCIVTTRHVHTTLWSISRYSKTKSGTEHEKDLPCTSCSTGNSKYETRQTPCSLWATHRRKLQAVHHLCNGFCHSPSISACLKALMILLAKPLNLSLNPSFNNTDGLSDLQHLIWISVTWRVSSMKS